LTWREVVPVGDHKYCEAEVESHYDEVADSFTPIVRLRQISLERDSPILSLCPRCASKTRGLAPDVVSSESGMMIALSNHKACLSAPILGESGGCLSRGEKATDRGQVQTRPHVSI
jgi:hypothetical protein